MKPRYYYFKMDSGCTKLFILLIFGLSTQLDAQTFADPVFNPFSLKPKLVRLTPCLIDLDGDGDKDVFTGSATGTFQYYQNIGNPNHPQFTDPVSNPFSLKNSGPFCVPSFGDLDGDGDFDLLVGSENGDLDYFQNIGTNQAPKFANVVLNPFLLNPTRRFLTPFLVDVDDDGDLDLMGGTESDGIAYAENTGSAKAAKFSNLVYDPFSIKSSENDLIPALADLDGDGDLDVLVANHSPGFEYFENIGTKKNPKFDSPKYNPFSIKPRSEDPSPYLADLDGDGDVDLLTGQSDRFNYYENKSLVQQISLISKSNEFRIYPNPTTDGKINIDFQGDQLHALEIRNPFGEIIFQNIGPLHGPLSIDLYLESNGLYLMYAYSRKRSYISKILKP